MPEIVAGAGVTMLGPQSPEIVLGNRGSTTQEIVLEPRDDAGAGVTMLGVHTPQLSVASSVVREIRGMRDWLPEGVALSPF